MKIDIAKINLIEMDQLCSFPTIYVSVYVSSFTFSWIKDLLRVDYKTFTDWYVVI